MNEQQLTDLNGKLVAARTDLAEKKARLDLLNSVQSKGGSLQTLLPDLVKDNQTVTALRGLRVTGIVTGECSSAALWPFAACKRRLVTPYSVMLFHPMKWQSEEHVGLHEAAEWARLPWC